MSRCRRKSHRGASSPLLINSLEGCCGSIQRQTCIWAGSPVQRGAIKRSLQRSLRTLRGNVNLLAIRMHSLLGPSSNVAATQTSLQTDQIHYQTQSLESSLQGNIQPVVNELSTLEQGCRNTLSNSNNLPPAQIQARDAACRRLGDAATPFRQKFDATAAGLVHLEQVYQGERSRQQRLLREAQRYAQ